jgi:hypothetical protein
MAKEPSERSLPNFNPPKPTLYAGLLNSFKVERELFARPTGKTFVPGCHTAHLRCGGPGANPSGLKTGLTVYNTYLTHTRNTISRFLLPEGKPEEATGSLATVCQGEVDVATCATTLMSPRLTTTSTTTTTSTSRPRMKSEEI